ncbi:LysR family transcriptional regulator [Megasphaera paucivorans]|uniref:DNA-binding transcriptional regulator, LysR family n=1 Tax=Megasphaera paucivorans TaxID=349095 RepID=A0A1G9Q9A7_9FIRM|nr:LysR family transcriptional regulator [Megasphaera paucivorans]SDM07662.1 DNA-binding transcriptional regulator, LysR family [Megasphaera paucivorans]
MNTKQLQYFIAAAENESFTKAAQQFHITQTAITQQIKSLEDQLQVMLFTRINHRVVLTQAGRYFLKESRALVYTLDKSVDQVRLIGKGISGSLRIGWITGFEQAPLHLLIQRFHESHPQISLQLERNSAVNLYDKLQNNDLDLVFNIRFDIGRYKNVLQLPIHEFPVVAVLPSFHPLTNKKYLFRDDLRAQPFIVSRTGETITDQNESISRYMTANIKYGQIYYANDTETMMLMVSAGLGISIVPSYMIPAINNNRIKTLPIRGINMKAEIITAWLDDTDNPSLPLMIQTIKDWKRIIGYVPKQKKTHPNVTDTGTLSRNLINHKKTNPRY